MNRANLIHELKALEPRLRASGVGALYLFGSWARGEENAASDIDIFVDPADPEHFGLRELIGARDIIAASLEAGRNRRIDFGTRAGLDKYIREAAEKDALRAF